MRWFIGMIIIAAFCLMPLAADAGPPDPKPKDTQILIAHLQEVVVTESEEIDDELGPVLVITTTKYYVVIEVSPNAAKAHEDHGDIDPGEYEKGDKFTMEEVEVIPIEPPA